MKENPPLVESAAAAYQAIRAINHLSLGAIPAPAAYEVLGNPKGIGQMLPQAFRQIGQGLIAYVTEYDAECVDPTMNVTQARSYLAEARQMAAEVGRLLESAQTAISHQGY